jgi:prolyl oligopeptidase
VVLFLKKRTKKLLLVWRGGVGAAGLLIIAAATPPVAPVRPVITTYFGTQVTDNYRWMETPGSKPLAAFMTGQNQFARAKLDSIPGRAKLLREITADGNLAGTVDALIIAGGRYFYIATGPGQNSGKLCMRDAGGKATLLIDPDRFGPPGAAESINFFQPSQDGRYLAYGISAGGSEAATLRVLDTTTMRDTGVAITRVDGANDEFLPVSWLPDGTLAYYRLHGLAPGEDPADFYLKSRVFLHHLGKNPNGDGDAPVFGYGVDPDVPTAPDQDALVMTVPGETTAFGVLTENESSDDIDAIYASPLTALEDGKPVWRQIAGKGDQVTGFDAKGDRIYLLTAKDAPHFKIIATSITKPDLVHAATIVPESDAVIQSFAVARDGLYVNSAADGFSRLQRFGGGPVQILNLPYSGTINSLVANEAADGAVFTLESWTRPALWFRYDPNSGKSRDTGLQTAPRIGINLVSREVLATSYDGTEIPLSIIMPEGTKLDGRNPTLLIGYGSYGITLAPSFDPTALPWFTRGGIIAYAHVRGGGWLGEGWHQDGMKLKKLNTVFDFIACARYLEERHYTAPAYLAGEGTSAGGITIGGAMNWAPDLFAAAIDDHGDTDLLRSEFTANGPPNIPEFGSVTTQQGFHGLYAMSPYANVRDGENYPAVLLETGANDPRVDPWVVAKMAARLQAATASRKPVLLSVSYDTGHGIGDTAAQEDAQMADEFAFMLWQFGVPGFQPTP